jgi:transcriptional regulator with XRE-family HTH domain
MTSLHSNVRRLRDAAELTSSEAARRAGISQGTWSDIERGKNPNPTPRTLEKIAAALGVTLAELFVDEKGESVTLE